MKETHSPFPSCLSFTKCPERQGRLLFPAETCLPAARFEMQPARLFPTSSKGVGTTQGLASPLPIYHLEGLLVGISRFVCKLRDIPNTDWCVPSPCLMEYVRDKLWGMWFLHTPSLHPWLQLEPGESWALAALQGSLGFSHGVGQLEWTKDSNRGASLCFGSQPLTFL